MRVRSCYVTKCQSDLVSKSGGSFLCQLLLFSFWKGGTDRHSPRALVRITLGSWHYVWHDPHHNIKYYPAQPSPAQYSLQHRISRQKHDFGSEDHQELILSCDRSKMRPMSMSCLDKGRSWLLQLRCQTLQLPRYCFRFRSGSFFLTGYLTS